jgi:uncharacterized membrane protein (Fun14 family)
LPLDASIGGITNGVATNAIGIGHVIGAGVAVAVAVAVVVVAVVVVVVVHLSVYMICCISDCLDWYAPMCQIIYVSKSRSI